MHKWEQECIKALVGKSEGKRPQRRYTPRWEDNVKMGIRATEWNGMDTIIPA
jgi:hypothetical protein